MVRKNLEDPQGWLESTANHSFVAVIFRIVLKRARGLRALGLLTSWFFLLEIECNKTMIRTIMVRKSLAMSPYVTLIHFLPLKIIELFSFQTSHQSQSRVAILGRQLGPLRLKDLRALELLGGSGQSTRLI